MTVLRILLKNKLLVFKSGNYKLMHFLADRYRLNIIPEKYIHVSLIVLFKFVKENLGVGFKEDSDGFKEDPS